MRVLGSALKHCTVDAVVHAISHPIRIKEELRPEVTLYIGASETGQLLEVLIDTSGDEPVVFHADLLRDRLRRQLLEGK